MVALATSPGSLDPAKTISTSAASVVSSVYTPLLSYRRPDGRQGLRLLPGLAERLPAVTDHGRRYAFRLRPGLHYGDGTPVRAGDVAHSIERLLRMASPGAVLFDGITGTARFAAHRAATIAGIATSDRRRTVTFHLDHADATFPYRLATTFASVVPSSTPPRDTPARPPAGVGPLRIRSITPGHDVVLERNPRFPRALGPPAAAQRLDLRVAGNQRVALYELLRDRVDVLFDPPPPDGLALARREAPGRFAMFPTLSTYYLFLNPNRPPFDALDARRAASRAIDREALRRLYAGLLRPSCSYFPHGIAGYRPGCLYRAASAREGQRRARALLRRSGRLGARVLVYGDDTSPAHEVATYVADALRRAGFAASPRIVAGAVYLQEVGSARTHAQIGLANWLPDFPDAADFAIPLDGRSVTTTGSVNPGRVRDPELDRDFARAQVLARPAARGRLYARAARRLQQRAYVIAYGNRSLVKLASRRVDFAALRISPVYGLDLSSIGP